MHGLAGNVVAAEPLELASPPERVACRAQQDASEVPHVPALTKNIRSNPQWVLARLVSRLACVSGADLDEGHVEQLSTWPHSLSALSFAPLHQTHVGVRGQK